MQRPFALDTPLLAQNAGTRIAPLDRIWIWCSANARSRCADVENSPWVATTRVAKERAVLLGRARSKSELQQPKGRSFAPPSFPVGVLVVIPQSAGLAGRKQGHRLRASAGPAARVRRLLIRALLVEKLMPDVGTASGARRGRPLCAALCLAMHRAAGEGERPLLGPVVAAAHERSRRAAGDRYGAMGKGVPAGQRRGRGGGRWLAACGRRCETSMPQLASLARNQHNGCLLAPFPAPSRRTADTLDSSTIHHLPTQPTTSEPSFLEPLNYSPAQCSFSSPSPSNPPFDFTSSTTASHQSTWLPSPAPHASRQPTNTSHTDFAPPHNDFVLYDQPAQAPLRPHRAPSAPQPGPLFNATPPFYANSAPTSTIAFPQPQSQQRPPVPLFNSSSNSIPQIHQNSNVAAMADLNSSNSFDSGASLFAGLQHEVSWEAPLNAFTTVNPHSVSSSTRTVSPKDIFADPFQSAPPSTTFTNMTSPDIDQSPFITDSFETSPMFQGDAYMPTDNWFSLFPEEDNKGAAPAVAAPLVAPALERTVSSNTTKSSGSSVNSPVVMSANSHRRKSSVNGSPVTNASITKPRRRKGPLPTIMVDPNDKVALKRARNTLAARDSRQRKFDHVNTLEKRNAELEAEVEKWKQIAYAQGYSGS
ncbi:hypothetical protein DPSP01_000196 [Paraphaeosphaeria sporulosa]